MAAATTTEELGKGDRVVAARDMRGVPEGTPGKVAIVNGLSWIRYWVRFGNGVAIGSLNRRDLMTPAEWDRRHDTPDEVAASDGASAEGGAAAADGGGVTVNGALVPQRLIDRSAAARARLGK